MRDYKGNPTEQEDSGGHAERVLQLLCLIAQSLHRIELQLGNIAGITPRPQPNKIVTFNAGGGR
jgi:hypothetical protein